MYKGTCTNGKSTIHEYISITLTNIPVPATCTCVQPKNTSKTEEFIHI